jgi:hypothetical protein
LYKTIDMATSPEGRFGTTACYHSRPAPYQIKFRASL